MHKGVDGAISTSIFWQLPAKLILIDRNLKIIEATKEWLDFFDFGHSSDVLSENYLPNLLGKEKDELKALVFECISTEKELSIDRIKLKNDKKYFSIRLKPFYNEINTEAVGATIQFDALDYELEISILNNRLKLKSEIANIGSWELNTANEKIHLCERAMMILGVEGSSTISINDFIECFKIGFSQNKLSMLLFGAAQKNESFTEKLQLNSLDSDLRWVMLNGKVFENKFMGTIQDISLLVNHEIRIGEKENLINALIDNLPTNIYVKDQSFRKTMVNKAECNFYNVEHKAELLGKNDFELLGERMAKVSMEEETQIFKSKQPLLNKQEEIITKNGKSTHLLTSKLPLLNQQGDVYSILGIGVDITSLKEKEEELKSLINITSVQNKKLLNFAHIISHNLRSHTANFSMLLDFLTTEKNPEEKKKIINMLISASDGLSETLANLNKVISFRDNVSLKIESVNLYSEIERLLESLNSFITKNNVIIVKKIPENIRVNAIVDYLDSIVLNFINNAVRYRHPNRQPKIVIKTKMENGRVRLCVVDNGLGIDLKKHGAKLFGMYKTFHENNSAKGIGLYINRNQVEVMNCTINVESEPDNGSTFSICFNE